MAGKVSLYFESRDTGIESFSPQGSMIITYLDISPADYVINLL